MPNSLPDTAAAGMPPTARWAPVWIIVFAALWPAPGIAEAVLALGALSTTAVLVWRWRARKPVLLSRPALLLVAGLFAAYWLPQLFSAVAAAEPGKVLGKAAAGLRYLPFMCLAAIAVATTARRRLAFAGLAVITAVWTLDALLQAVTGTSPLFWAMDQLKWQLNGHGLCTAAEVAAADRLSGVFGPCNLKFGQVLASLSPFLLFAAAARRGRAGWLLAVALVGVVLVLAGSRASWISYALVLLLSGWRLLGGRWMVLLMLAGLSAIVVLGSVSPQVQQRLARTELMLQGDPAAVDQALAGRLSIWKAALCMVREHPLTGVGVRNFREVYPQCDPSPEQTAAWGGGVAFHAHQIVLEVLAETGIVGLLSWLAGAWLALRAWWRAGHAARERARPAALALLVTVFPLNTHLAFYSSFWGGLALLLLALYAGALQAADDEDRAPAAAQRRPAE